MTTTSHNPKKETMLPFRWYMDSLETPTHKSILFAKIQLETGVSSETIKRFYYGVYRPKMELRIPIAAIMSTEFKKEISGDELFPATFPYKGSHAKAN